MNWWVHSLYENLGVVALVSWIFWVLFSITLHELAHGWTAIWQGDDTPRQLDRLTLNPIVHMGGTALIIFALCGVTWGAMPVNPSRFRDRRLGEIIVSAAGPAMNFALALACVVLGAAWMAIGSVESAAYENVATFFAFGAGLNVILGILNLFPIPPLDGSRIVAGLSWRARQLFAHPNAPMVSMLIFVAVFFMSPVGDVLFALAFSSTGTAIGLLAGLLGA